MTSRRRTASALTGALLLVPVLYLVVCWAVVAILITPDRRAQLSVPLQLGPYQVRPLSFVSRTDGLSLRGRMVGPEAERAIIVVHGLHSHAWDCSAPDLAGAYSEAGVSVLVFDLRAHGQSGGAYVGLGVLERGDVRAAVDVLLQAGVRPGRIGIHRTSYGAAVALLAASDIENIGAVIADSAFASVKLALGGEHARQRGVLSLIVPGYFL